LSAAKTFLGHDESWPSTTLPTRMQKLFGENYNRDKNYENIWSAQVLERQLGVATLTGCLLAKCLQIKSN